MVTSRFYHDLSPLAPHDYLTIFVRLQGACRHNVMVCLMIVQWNLTTYHIARSFIIIAVQNGMH
jgi:hypothetical protein